MVLLLEHLVGVVGQILVIDVHQSVLHELHASYLFGICLHVLFLHIHLVLLHELVFSEMPFEFLEHLVEVFLQFLRRHLLVRGENPAFEEINRELEFLHLLHDGFFGVQTELVFAVLRHVGFNLRLDACAESSFVFRSVCAIYFSEQLRIDSSGRVAGDFLNLEGEIALQVLGLLFVDTEQRAYFYFAVKSLGRVESNHIAFLGSDELLLLRFLLHVSRIENRVLFDDISVHLLSQTFDDVAFCYLISLCVLAETLCVTLHLVVYHLVRYLDDVLGQFVLAGQFGIELRSNGDVEEEGEGVLVIEVNLRRVLAWERFAEDLEIVVLDVFLQSFAYLFVEHVSKDAFTVHFLHQTGRYHARTETRHLCLLAHLFELLCNFVLIVSRLNSKCHNCRQVFQFTLFNFHCYIIFNFEFLILHSENVLFFHRFNLGVVSELSRR